ncbi:HAD family hydrolase [Aureispira sp. CCB-E]|uniref:HAD family hydrolase n=1 Tax=Aureispira sp. CCB-E TaxID=3051121 RepID=UPI002869216A|nr:HAD family hydrolase [Aureispira sp. CCB-E]WMX17171.1 HAD family hydrolase [Aureispira sp. CCB-E]
MLNEQENISRVEACINEILAQSDKSIFLIIDGDRTLISTDSTKYFFKHLELEFIEIKSIFQKYDYTFEAFYHVALFYSRIDEKRYKEACIASAKAVNIYSDFLKFIKAVKDKTELILITSGIAQSWQNVIDNHSLDFMHLIGGNYFPKEKFVVDKNAKGIIANKLKLAGKKVFAFGDTLIDFDMLQNAHHSYLIVNEKMNKDIIPHSHEIAHLKQISFSSDSHQNLPLTDLIKVTSLIHKYYENSTNKNS